MCVCVCVCVCVCGLGSSDLFCVSAMRPVPTDDLTMSEILRKHSPGSRADTSAFCSSRDSTSSSFQLR